MQNSRVVVLLALAGLLLVGLARASHPTGEELVKLHDVVAPEAPVDPFVKLLVDGKAVQATYYDPRVKAEQYSESRRIFDRELIDVVAAFNLDFVEDMLIKKRYLITITPKYMGRITSLIAHYLPEYSRFVKASADEGMPVKHGFIGDSTGIWTQIQEALANPEKCAQARGDMPKNGEEFVKKAEELMQTAQIMVQKSPVGIYVDWSNVTIDGKNIEQIATPLFLYLKENGYNKHLAVIDSMVGLLRKVKPGSAAYEGQA